MTARQVEPVQLDPDGEHSLAAARQWDDPHLVDRIPHLDRVPAQSAVGGLIAAGHSPDPAPGLADEADAELPHRGIVDERQLGPGQAAVHGPGHETL